MAVDPILIRAGYAIGIAGALVMTALDKRKLARVGAAISAAVIALVLWQYKGDARAVQIVTAAATALGGIVAVAATMLKRTKT